MNLSKIRWVGSVLHHFLDVDIEILDPGIVFVVGQALSVEYELLPRPVCYLNDWILRWNVELFRYSSGELDISSSRSAARKSTTLSTPTHSAAFRESAV